MVRFYADENFPFEVVQALRNLGHDVLRAQEAGNANQKIPDSDVLDFATKDGRAVLTLNRWDFIRLHNTRSNHEGIVACSRDPYTEQQAAQIHAVVIACESLTGKLIRIYRTTDPSTAVKPL